MASLIELAGRTLALQYDGPGDPLAAGTGIILPAGRVALLHGLGDGLFYRHGQNSWSPCGWRRLSEPPLRIADARRRVTADDAAWDDPCRHHSSAVAAIQGADGNVLLLGALGVGTPRLTADHDTLAGWYESGGAPWFLAYGTEQEVFGAYVEQLATHLGRGQNRAGNVWCSWYAYYEDITEQELDKDIKALRGLPFDVVQVDDGWEREVGDWHPNQKFPSGMRALSERIADSGMTPGLWVAPFIALPDSDLARNRSELLLRDTAGDPVVAGYNWGTGYYALDVTLPAVQDHLADLIDRLVHQWGYRYLKLDFVNAAAVPGVRANGGGREEAYREGLALIRRTAGDDVYLLGSGAILLPSLGILDGLRSGPDVAPMWQNYATDDPSDAMARNAVVNTLHRLWHAPLADVDPDVVYFRSRLNLLTDEQQHWLRDLAAICGFRAVSDPVGWLTGDELQAMTEYLLAAPRIERTGRYTFLIDGRPVDFGGAIDSEASHAYPIS
ncbi:alpha-galactosidase [Kribbella jejuensis]|uniref:Alpha-galactosidase n=1 Tax=Kribbella jejuensis TaxID=236068 RepID=A0A542E8I3_9ACTN|nr:glycoside hydrolase family 36 protein [Kribbella jejuensis]TQJ11627.1 alpha-galactosidase [Kribbella jejuensis]